MEKCWKNLLVDIGIWIRITGDSLRKALETEKRYAGIIFTSGEKGNICFFCLSSVSGNLEPKKFSYTFLKLFRIF